MIRENMIFLPGLACDHRLFEKQIEYLKARYFTKTIICDSKSSMADHVKFVLDSSPEQFILVGHSLGGEIAQWIAIEAPERISQLILIGTGTGKLTTQLRNIYIEMKTSFEEDKASEFFEKINSLTIHEKRQHDQELQNLIKLMQATFSKEKLLNQVKTELEAKDTSEYLKNIKCNTLLIHGKQDAFYQEDMQFLKRHIPCNHYVEIDDCGHMIPIEQAPAVSALIKLWLDVVYEDLSLIL